MRFLEDLFNYNTNQKETRIIYMNKNLIEGNSMIAIDYNESKNFESEEDVTDWLAQKSNEEKNSTFGDYCRELTLQTYCKQQ
jgi:hypothetical protein